MPAIAHDLELSTKDHKLLGDASRGEDGASIAAMERFHPVILTFIYRHTQSFDAAIREVDGLARQLFTVLMNGQLAPDQFAHAIGVRAAAIAAAQKGDGGTTYSLMETTKLSQRRAV